MMQRNEWGRHAPHFFFARVPVFLRPSTIWSPFGEKGVVWPFQGSFPAAFFCFSFCCSFSFFWGRPFLWGMGVRRWLRLAVTSLFSLLRQMLDLFVSADLFAGQATYGPYLKESDYFSPSVTSDVLNGRSPSSDPESTMGRALVTLSMRSLRTTALLPRGIQKTLVLDLDETLIHSTTKASRDYDTKIDVALDRSSCTFYVYKRPHVDYFLRQASRWYELVIFTASTAEYAAPVIDWLDPQRLISRRYYREVWTFGYFLLLFDIDYCTRHVPLGMGIF